MGSAGIENDRQAVKQNNIYQGDERRLAALQWRAGGDFYADLRKEALQKEGGRTIIKRVGY